MAKSCENSLPLKIYTCLYCLFS